MAVIDENNFTEEYTEFKKELISPFFNELVSEIEEWLIENESEIIEYIEIRMDLINVIDEKMKELIKNKMLQ